MSHTFSGVIAGILAVLLYLVAIMVFGVIAPLKLLLWAGLQLGANQAIFCVGLLVWLIYLGWLLVALARLSKHLSHRYRTRYQNGRRK